jgi:hypothetical protein
MKIAKEFDPQCQCQLIAASKIDKYNKGIAEKLQGFGAGRIQLRLGFVAVRNRTPEELQENISFEEMKQCETAFFASHHREFGQLSDEFKGCEQLVKRLAHIQQERIQSTFPRLLEQLKEQIRLKRNELKTILAAMTTEQECRGKFQAMIDALRKSIHAKVNGDYHQKVELMMTVSTNILSSHEEGEYEESDLSEVNNINKVVEKSLRTKLFFFFLFKEKNYESSND